MQTAPSVVFDHYREETTQGQLRVLDNQDRFLQESQKLATNLSFRQAKIQQRIADVEPSSGIRPLLRSLRQGSA